MAQSEIAQAVAVPPSPACAEHPANESTAGFQQKGTQRAIVASEDVGGR
mgnify:CR=1 FL=1